MIFTIAYLTAQTDLVSEGNSFTLLLKANNAQSFFNLREQPLNPLHVNFRHIANLQRDTSLEASGAHTYKAIPLTLPQHFQPYRDPSIELGLPSKYRGQHLYINVEYDSYIELMRSP